MTPLTVTTDHIGDGPVLRVSGEIDMASGPVLHAPLALVCERSERGDQVLVDLTDVAFLGSTGIALLVEAHKVCARRGSALVVLAPNREARRPLEVTAVNQLFAVVTELPAPSGPGKP